MKIGIDCRLFSTGFTGIGRYTHELVEHFVKLNNALSAPHQLVLFFNNPEYEKFETPENVKKILVNAKHYSVAEQLVFLKKLNKEKLDIVHFPHFNVPIAYKKPYVVTIHDLTLSIFPGQKMTKWYHRVGYNMTIKNATKRAEKIIAVSENTKRDIVKMLKIPEEKINVIYNGVTPDFKVIPAYKHEKSHTPFLLYTGVWRNHKNLPRLIEAFKILKSSKFQKEHNYNLTVNGQVNNKTQDSQLTGLTSASIADQQVTVASLKLVITGKPDSHYPEVKNTVKLLGLEHDVVFPGFVSEEELIKLYNEATIFVFPSLYEGFGLPPLEAMSCGTPVAASNCSSIPEICGQGNAVFFDPHDKNDIAEKIFLLYKNPVLQENLIKSGLARAAKFSWEKTAAETFELILNSANHII